MSVLQKITFCDQVVRLLKQRIRDSVLPPGTPLFETVLANELGISRAPVREALQLLEFQGLVEFGHGRTRRVTVLRSADIQERYEIGGILEGAAAVAAVELLSLADWEKMEWIVERLSAPETTEEELLTLGQSLHSVVLAKAPNRRMVDIAYQSCRLISGCLLFCHWRNLYSREHNFQRHKRMHEALLTRDPTGIEKITREHYAETAELLASCNEHS